jgi:hypothetical protein
MDRIEQTDTLAELGEASAKTLGAGHDSFDGIGNAKPLEGVDDAE